MKKIWVGAMLLLALSGVYLKYEPALIYYVGEIKAEWNRHGQVAGEFVYRLDVPWHRQEHSLSCEIASLKMALAGVGLNIPEQELINRLAFDPTPRANGVWGDPYTGFVGSIDGKMLGDGYGVYWDPVAKVGNAFTRTDVIKNASLPELIYHLNQKHPVVVWGYFGGGRTIQWTTPAGKTISGVNGEHARTLIGYTGSMVNPDKLILLDPIYGEIYWNTLDFLENWGALENGAIVVYDHPRWAKAPGDNTVWEIGPDASFRRGLNMDWNTFITEGGVGEGIKQMSADWLYAIPDAGVTTTMK